MTKDILVEYFEPNDMNIDTTTLNIFVQLEIEKISKSLIQQSKTLKFTTVLKSKDNINFYSNILTNSIEDMLVLQEEGSKELIGMTKIDVSYSSWYYPKVSIEFVDIRGNGVMNSLQNLNESPIFESFFTFPYPKFKLTIKGYLGRSVTYELAVENVKTRVDSGSGVYKIDVDMIGYLFGALQDIPMHLLLLSPYIHDAVDLGNFYGTDIKIPTLLELFNKIRDFTIDNIGGTSEEKTLLEREKKYDEHLSNLVDLRQEIEKGVLPKFKDEETEKVKTKNVTLDVNLFFLTYSSYNSLSGPSPITHNSVPSISFITFNALLIFLDASSNLPTNINSVVFFFFLT